MKKILLSILMLLLTVTAAWAGDGDGSKGHPFTGVWQASELAPKLDKGKYLAYDCDIRNGEITVIDSKLNTQIAGQWVDWAPGNHIGASPAPYPANAYQDYFKYNSLDDRKSQLFLITDAKKDGSKITLTGFFSGYYDYAGPVLPKKKVGDVEYYVINSADDYETFRQIVATGNPYANAVLEANITVTKPIGSGGPQFHYRGTFDGQCHTITLNMTNTTTEPYGLFQYTEPGCVIRNLKVSGKIDTNSTYFGSIVGDATGTTIERCISDATLKGQANIGGLIGISRGKCFLENCAYIGSIEGGATASALVGKNSQKISIKSCYSAPDVSASSASTVNAFTDKISKVETNLNNHYLGNLSTANQEGEASVIYTPSPGSGTKGKRLCYDLNKNGRNGVVWFMHEDIPYPFRGTDGNPIYGDNNGEVIITVVSHGGGLGQGDLGHTHEYGEDHICSKCGYIEDGVNIDPLQNSGIDEMYAKGDVYVGLLRYSLDKNSKTATVKGTHKLAKTERDDVNAVHIPETIIYNGVKYTVKYIGKSSFNSSVMEYCYIPKTVNNIADDAFNDCKKLKYLHFADGPSAAPGSGPEAGVYMGHKAETHELFEDCPLEKVYIGRNLRWYSDDLNPDEPFEDRDNITDVFFGPRVSRIGNANYTDAREGRSYDLFNNCTGIQRVYIMGDDQSLGEEDLQDFCRDGLAKATTYYINRSVAYTKYWNYSVGRYDDMGALDRCENVSYGPFVKYIAKESFCGTAANNNNTMKRADFTNAFRLERIEENAFNECTELTGALDFSNTQLKEIEHDAFYNVDQVTEVNFGSNLEKIGEKAFNDSESIKVIALPGTVMEVGEKAFGDMKKLGTIRIEDSAVSGSYIKFGSNAFNSNKGVSSIYLGRNLNIEGNGPFYDCTKTNSIVIGPSATELIPGIFRKMESIGAFSFLHSPNPLTIRQDVFYDSPVRAMFIDRELLYKEDSKEATSDIKWQSDINSFVENLSFGDNINHIPDHLFDNFIALKFLIIPASVKTIGDSSFLGCSKLESVYILGDITVNAKAFANCTNLRRVFLMGQKVLLNNNPFANCNKIEEVVTGFLEASEELVGSEEAFTQDAYDKAHLVCAGDTKTQKIDFGTITPWCLFNSANRNKIVNANDYDIEDGEKSGNYDHGYMPHSFTKDKYELVYAPFQMDSYYFGPEADIYKMSIENLSTENASFEDEYTPTDVDFTYKTDDLKFTKVDIDSEMLLSRGVYLINTKTDKPLSNIASYHNLFKQQKVSVDNRSFFINEGSSSYSTASMSYNSNYPIGETIPAIDDDVRCSFVCDGGVLKYVNGEYQPKVGEIVFKDYYEPNKQTVFNMMEGQNPLLSSKIDMPFKAILDGYASFYASETAGYNYIAPSWCDVYIVTSAGETVTLENIADRTINAGQAVLLKSNKEEKLSNDITEHLTFATNPSSASYTGNLLKGVEKDTEVSALGREFVYVLSKTAGNSTGFYKYNKKLSAGKAYLDPDGLSTENLAKSCLFAFNDSATGIKPMSESMSESVYDLMGRRLKEAGFKGVYIVNGKKVVVK